MGTCDFSSKFLREVIKSKHKLKAVFTQRPKPKGRGMKEEMSEVHKLALSNNLEVFTPKTLRSEESFKIISEIEADAIIVVSYGFIIPKNILDLKKHGCINVHPSDLPKYRGPSPMQYTIMNGETETAVCIMQMDEGVDTGDIIFKEKINIDYETDLSSLEEISFRTGSKMLIDVLDNLEIDSSYVKKISYEQTETGVSLTQKITKEMGKINWGDCAFKINCIIRSIGNQVSVYFIRNNMRIKIIKSNFDNLSHNYKAGTVIDLKKRILVACGSGFLEILELQREGKRAMSAAEFLLGNKIELMEVLM